MSAIGITMDSPGTDEPSSSAGCSDDDRNQ
jgi:hypothetical protein